MAESMSGRKEPELTTPAEAVKAELAKPQEEEKDVVTPEMIADMTSDEFSEYLQNPEAYRARVDEPAPEEAEEEEEEAVEEAVQPFKSFATAEEYEADRKKAVEEAFNKRFKHAKENEERLSTITRRAKGNYPESDDPIRDMLDEMDNHAAESRGTSVEDYRRDLDERAELAEFRAYKNAQRQQQEENERTIRGWQREAAELKTLVPDFNFDAAIQNKTFADAISGGATVAQAYMLMQSKEPKQPEAKAKRKEIAQNAMTKNKGTGESSVNPATMSDKDFKEYINRIAGHDMLV